MNPAEYFDEFVSPAYCDFQGSPVSRRHALQVCMLALHFADAVAVHRGIMVKEVVTDFGSRCPAFLVAEACCLAVKHIRIRKVAYEGQGLSDIGTGPGAAFTDGAYFDDGTTFSDVGDSVVYAPDGGQPHDLAYVLDQVVSFLAREANAYRHLTP
ncbi:MAG: hypothetical protein EXQ95_03035 [Alphaproteobacteria bacterium]|nr:hypothetical protein [Alphaproteobacteria bacterium]